MQTWTFKYTSPTSQKQLQKRYKPTKGSGHTRSASWIASIRFRLIHSTRASLRARTSFHLPLTQDNPTASFFGRLSLSDRDWRTFRTLFPVCNSPPSPPAVRLPIIHIMTALGLHSFLAQTRVRVSSNLSPLVSNISPSRCARPGLHRDFCGNRSPTL